MHLDTERRYSWISIVEDCNTFQSSLWSSMMLIQLSRRLVRHLAFQNLDQTRARRTDLHHSKIQLKRYYPSWYKKTKCNKSSIVENYPQILILNKVITKISLVLGSSNKTGPFVRSLVITARHWKNGDFRILPTAAIPVLPNFCPYLS